MDSPRGTLEKRLLVNLSCLLVCGFITFLVHMFGSPVENGFFCEDMSIRYPYLKSTISASTMYVVGLGFPVLVITGIRLAQSGSSCDSYTELYGVKVRTWQVKCSLEIIQFAFGAFCNELLTLVGKQATGKLRPHFFVVCDPDVDCKWNAGSLVYHAASAYRCRGKDTARIYEARMSFPSGHSSYSAYSSWFLVVLLQRKMKSESFQLLKHAMQFSLVFVGWFTSLTRISDLKHHWPDVVGGYLLGTAIATIITTFVSDTLSPKKLLKKTRSETEPVILSREDSFLTL